MTKPLLGTLCALILCATQAVAGNGSGSGHISTGLIEIARKSLADIQYQSFSSGLEYCGMIGKTRAGELIVSPARRGRPSGCNARGFTDPSITLVASYHTHGGFDPNMDSEVPSTDDVDMDHHQGVFGFVATPGGRLWLIDHRSRVATQICGKGCLPSDPTFSAGMAGPIPLSLSRKDMIKRQVIGGPRQLRHDHQLANSK
jgi:hypothetical protein